MKIITEKAVTKILTSQDTINNKVVSAEFPKIMKSHKNKSYEKEKSEDIYMKNLIKESNSSMIDSVPNISEQAPRGIFGSLLLTEKFIAVIFYPFDANVKMAKELVGLFVLASDRFEIQLAV